MPPDDNPTPLELAERIGADLGDATAGPITTSARAAFKAGRLAERLRRYDSSGDGAAACEPPLADEEVAEARRCIRKINEFFAAHRDVDERLGEISLAIREDRERLDAMEARPVDAKPAAPAQAPSAPLYFFPNRYAVARDVNRPRHLGDRSSYLFVAGRQGVNTTEPITTTSDHREALTFTSEAAARAWMAAVPEAAAGYGVVRLATSVKPLSDS